MRCVRIGCMRAHKGEKCHECRGLACCSNVDRASDPISTTHTQQYIHTQGFTEGPLYFRPTYKLDVGVDRYDSGPKRRVPAWTDRVLFKPVRQAGATQGFGERRAYMCTDE